ALTRCAAMDVAEHGIRINAVAPSIATHPFLAKVTSEETLAALASREAFGRAAQPWEVANVIVFLASDYSSYMTGEVVAVSSQRPYSPGRHHWRIHKRWAPKARRFGWTSNEGRSGSSHSRPGRTIPPT